MTFVYFVPLQIVVDGCTGASFWVLLKDFLFLSKGPYWFIRTYILFYLFTPVINLYLENIDDKARWNLLLILFIINVWFGALTAGDLNLNDGKNIMNFIFLYVIANTFRRYRNVWLNVQYHYLLIPFILLNVLLVGVYYFIPNDVLRKVIVRISFGYNSPILLLNAALLFLIFGKIKVTSKFINKVAASMFAVYLISEHWVVQEFVLKDVLNLLMLKSTSLELILELLILTAVILIICVFIDKLFSPLWRFSQVNMFKKVSNN